MEVPGFKVRNFKDEPKLALRVGRPDGGNDGKRRTLKVSMVIIHTTKGIPGGSDKRPQILHPGMGPDTKAEDRTVNYWSTDPKPSGAHLVVDHDGSMACLADLATVTAYHAGNSLINDCSIGIEMFQGSDAGLYEGQLKATVALVNVLTAQFGIQRQIPDMYRRRPVPVLEKGGKGVFGVFGHRDVSDNRGQGDPGDFIFDFLAKGGYERFNFDTREDKLEWKKRQAEINKKLNLHLDEDGVPGPGTRAALKLLGYGDGLWVNAPVTK